MANELLIAIGVATGIVVVLSLLVLAARWLLVHHGTASISINGERKVSAEFGETLLWALANNGVSLPSVCGGRGSCGLCHLTILSGADKILPTEEAQISRRNIKAGERLACLVTIRRDLDIRVPNAALDEQRLTCRVRSNDNVTAYLKELVLTLPASTALSYQAGDYLIIHAPSGRSCYSEFDLNEEYRGEWQRRGLLKLSSTRESEESRAYSIANAPHQTGVIELVVRIAIPPAGAPARTPPGKVSAYLFGLRPDDEVVVSGPFGNFHASESSAEMILIGGGAGIAPLRAIILDQLLGKRTKRQISFWYGARNVGEICFGEEFDALAAKFDNFTWQAAISDAKVESNWSGFRGFIHTVVLEQYLDGHPTPEDAEYFLCGPPLMSSAVLTMLEDLDVAEDNIFFDDFGTR
jgi:Na+-transporting NADH:ubiquinone oxidoreductase subunit F